MTAREKILLGVFGLVLAGYLSMKKWEVPKEAAPYIDEIRRAESANGLPHNLLARLLWVESHYRPDIISGKTISKAGAIGIAQIVPKWHPNVDPRDPVASIRYAGQFLAQLKRQLGTWDKAVAGYNTGAGNVQKALTKASNSGADWLTHVTDETKNYVVEIIPVIGLSRNV
jgi:soluble lytic murein transglycosylase-like protein